VASKLKLDRAQVKAFPLLLASRHVAKTARQIETAAKRLAPVRKPDPPRNTPGGTLRASIGTKQRVTTYKVDAKVGSKKKYALYPHSGARPHPIVARKKKFLVFPWPDGPRDLVIKKGKWAGYVVLPKVNHPGQKATRYLTIPLRGIGRANGFRVSVKRSIG